MKVTLNVFSGRENPSWYLSEKDAASFLERVAKKTVLSAAEHHSDLGYSGFTLEANSDERLPDGIPSSFFIDGKLAAGISEYGHHHPLMSLTESGDAAQWLISKAGKEVQNDIASYVLGEIKAREKPATPKADEKIQEDLELKNLIHPAACIIANTPYNPAFWNAAGIVNTNNCYNFAMNFRSNTFAQPGRKTGHMYTSLDCNSVGNGASSDGCQPTCNGSSKLVALVIWPGVDFHWYRRQQEGFWAHKPGGTPVRNYDSSNNTIDGVRLTPANCNRGKYTIFCGYRYSPTGMQVS